MIKLTNKTKVRQDTYQLKLDDAELRAIIKARVEDILRDKDFIGEEVVFQSPLSAVAGQIDIEIDQHSGSDRFEANVYVRLDRTEVAP